MRIPYLNYSLDTIRAIQGFHIFRQGANILLAVLLAKSELGLEGIGLYELLTYIGATLSFFWVTGALQSFLTVFPNTEQEAQKRLLFSAYAFFCVMALLTALLMLLGRDLIREVLAGGASLDFYGLYTAYLAVNLPTYLLEHFLQLYQRPKAILGFGLLSFGGHLLVVALPVYLGMGLYGGIAGLVGLAVVKHVILLVFLIRNARWQLDIGRLLHWLFLALPLAGYALIGGFSQAFDGWLVNWVYEGQEQVFATWRYGARELPFSLALAVGLGTGLLPSLSANVEAGLEETRRRSLRLQHFLFPLAIVLMASSWWWFPLVFSTAFSDSVPVFNIFLLIIISRLVLSRTIMTGLKANDVVLWVSIIELGINVGLSFLLVSRMGLAGVALGTVLAYTFEKVAHGAWLYWKYGIPPGRYMHLGWLSAYSALLLAVFGWTWFW